MWKDLVDWLSKRSWLSLRLKLFILNEVSRLSGHFLLLAGIFLGRKGSEKKDIWRQTRRLAEAVIRG
jgi:hypothetical protein